MSIHQTRAGHWVLDNDEYHTRWVEASGRLDHDRYILPIIWPYIKPGSLVIDVGAHIGTHTTCYLDGVGPDGAVLAFEPNPDAYSALIRNCPLAVSYNWAVGAKVGDNVWVKNADNAGASHMAMTSGKTHMTTLDHELRLMRHAMGEKTVSLIKIDTEGFELNVLIGATETVDKYKPTIFLEYQQPGLERNGQSGAQLRWWLENHGYDFQFLPDESDWTTTQCDILATPFLFPIGDFRG